MHTKNQFSNFGIKYINEFIKIIPYFQGGHFLNNKKINLDKKGLAGTKIMGHITTMYMCLGKKNNVTVLLKQNKSSKFHEMRTYSYVSLGWQLKMEAL